MRPTNTNQQQSQNGYQTFSNVQKLNTNNIYAWVKVVEPYLCEKGYELHLLFDSFSNFMISEHYVQTDRERSFDEDRAYILADKKLSETEKKGEYRRIESEYRDVGTKRANEEKEWRQKDSKLKGILKGVVEEHMWLAAGNEKSAGLIWKKLKVEAQMRESGNFMSLLTDFFNSTQKEKESLVDYLACVQLIAQKLREVEEKQPDWKEVVCFRILSGLKKEHDQIQQMIFQMPRDQVKIETMKIKFAAEDSRKNASNNQEQKRNEQEEPSEEAHMGAARERCRKCGGKLERANYRLCQVCYEKQREERKEKSKDKREESHITLAF